MRKQPTISGTGTSHEGGLPVFRHTRRPLIDIAAINEAAAAENAELAEREAEAERIRRKAEEQQAAARRRADDQWMAANVADPKPVVAEHPPAFEADVIAAGKNRQRSEAIDADALRNDRGQVIRGDEPVATMTQAEAVAAPVPKAPEVPELSEETKAAMAVAAPVPKAPEVPELSEETKAAMAAGESKKPAAKPARKRASRSKP